ncbi:MAG: hypothetical protein HY928_14680 [Elusimicrobia bacterium]|nr:hypothetical protein [Elusimicrobiota bacterium]
MARDIHIHIRIGRRTLIGALAGAILLGVCFEVVSQTMELTTYYPSPVGIYRKLVTVLDAVLARDGGQVLIGNPEKPVASIGGRQVKMISVGTLVVDDVYLANPVFGSPRWASREPVELDFSSPGTYVWIVPTGVTEVSAELWGGGGGGGGDNSTGGGGGGGGGYVKGVAAVVPGSTLQIVVGAGGSGGGVAGCWHCGGGDGGDGQASRLLGLTAYGGAHGKGAFAGFGGQGGGGQGGDVRSGAAGQAGTVYLGSAAGGAAAAGGAGGGGSGGKSLGWPAPNTAGGEGGGGRVFIRY